LVISASQQRLLLKVRVGIQDWSREYLWGYLFILPSLALFAVFFFYPLVWAFVLGFQKFSVFHTQWVGLRNYQFVLANEVFRRAIVNTLIYTGVTIPVGIAISVFLAVLIFRLHSTGQSIYKAAYYLPGQIGGVILAFVWLWIFDPRIGLLTFIVRSIGLDSPLWLAEPRSALWSIIGMSLAGGQGAGVILYLAAMGGIPRSLYDAADIDAASGWTKFRRITWPLLLPTTVYLLILGIIGAFQFFGPIYILTQGGPDFGTTTVVYHIYYEFFQLGEFGPAAAESFILGAVIVVISLIQYRLFASNVEY
jgi:multiple sugar transport system permease protein